ncbi:MAG: ABC transporter ATP-binding protein [Synergistaceae bacterium]|jgi:iron complex transport system ATP-binding protein|nr:ABC transporter ATP-binding protein [Synergistaceae bacterium]
MSEKVEEDMPSINKASIGKALMSKALMNKTSMGKISEGKALRGKVLIRANRVGFRYSATDDWILKNFSFELSAGEVMAVLGPNGRGKTTLLKLLIGLMKPAEGDIQCNGRLSYVPQVSTPAFDYKVIDMVVMGRASEIGLFSVPGATDYKYAGEALLRLGIADLAQRTYSQLSGGQRQLVLIARALVSMPCGLVLDEPTSALDFKNQDLILRTLRQLASQGLSIVMTTHAPNHALHVANRILILEQGTQYLYGSPSEVMTHDELHKLYGLELKKLTFTHRGQELQSVVPIFS